VSRNEGIGRVTRAIRMKAGAFVVDNVFRGLSALGRLHPDSNPKRYGLAIARDLAYRKTGKVEHRLDVWSPPDTVRRPLPVVFYVHGGGFRFLSKDTHWALALSFARQGYLVVNVSYRLAPRHPFPAAIEDVCDAWRYFVAHCEEWGGDLSRVAVAGESAGANLVTGLTIAACYERGEHYARAVFDAGVVPRASLPMCGLLQVSDVDRFTRRRKLPRLIHDRLVEVMEAYLGENAYGTLYANGHELYDPLCILERGHSPERPLPPFFTGAGTKDPVLDDTRRLHRALERLGVECEAHYYPGEPHAFHALVMTTNAQLCWQRTFAFLDRALSSELRQPFAVETTHAPIVE
jgi:acetyl esterase